MAVAYVGAGSGAAITGASGTVSKTGCTAGNLIIVQALIDGTGQTPSFSAITNIEDLAGTDGALTEPDVPSDYDVGSPAAAVQSLRVGRVIANGTVSVDIGITSNDVYARIYEFSGVASGTTFNDVSENTEGNPNQALDTSALPQTPLVTTTGVDRLICALTALNDDGLALDLYDVSWSGGQVQFESATGTDGTIDLQMKPAPTAQTYGSNSDNLLASAAWGVLTFALIPAADVAGAGRRIYKRLFGPAHLGTSAADLYTVPAGTKTTIRRIFATNPSGSPVDFTFSIGADAAATRLYDSENIPAAGDVEEARDHTLEAGEKIQAYAGSATTVVLVVDGYEESI